MRPICNVQMSPDSREAALWEPDLQNAVDGLRNRKRNSKEASMQVGVPALYEWPINGSLNLSY